MSNPIATLHSFVLIILANSDSASNAEEITPFLKYIAIVLSIVTPLAILTGHLQTIIDFCQKNLFRKKTELSTEQLSKLRGQLLTRLKSDISIRQKSSLHNLVQIDLYLEEQRHQVGGKTSELIPADPENRGLLNRLFRRFNRSELTEIKPTQKTIEFFAREDIRGKLLILGEPGSGKTTELIDLSKDLIQRAIDDENASIPIIFELSTWKDNKPIRDWLVEQLIYTYKGIPKRVAEHWIDQQQLLPLLDGLDELGLELQAHCIDALNQFLDSGFQSRLVVCCRREEYEQAKNKLIKLNGAIYLQPLSDKQIQQYLKSLKREKIWHETIVEQPNLLGLVRQPLFLSMLLIAYQGRAIKNYSELFDSYIEKQLNNPDNLGVYPPKKSLSHKQTLHYLIWLARKLEVNKQTELLLEEIQPTWLESAKQKFDYSSACNSIASIILTPFLMVTLISMPYLDRITEGFTFGLITMLNLEPIEILFFGSMIIVFATLILTIKIFSRKIGIIEKLDYWLIEKLIPLIPTWKLRIKPTEKLSFSLKKFIHRFLIFWIILNLTVWLSSGLSEGLLLLIGLLAGLLVALFIAPIVGLRSLKIEVKNTPNQGIKNSLRNGVTTGVITGLIYGVVSGLFLTLSYGLWTRQVVLVNEISFKVFLMIFLLYGVTFGITFGLWYGLFAAIQHLSLRIILYQNGYIPWNYAKFLDHAAKHKFIQRVGGRYRFMHDLLRKHFAQMPLS